jgi:hypothetical protein
MSTRWEGNFINFSIELYFGICSVQDAYILETLEGEKFARVLNGKYL